MYKTWYSGDEKMSSPKKKKSVLPTYAFGLTWLLCAILFDWGFLKCLIVACIVRWIVSSIFKNRNKKEKEKSVNEASEKAKIKTEEKIFQTEDSKHEEQKTSGNPELDAVLQEGRESVAKLQQINDEIPDFKLSAKLKQIEILTASIVDQVERKPDKVKEVRQFMNYYLPTTIKLLEQYVQLQNVGLKGENIESGMQQIEAMLDKVIVAFQKQLDSLFERDVVDITADIQVMEQMMAAQGLTDTNDFSL